VKKPRLSRAPKRLENPKKRVNLKVLADHLGLSPATVSLVMNRSSMAHSIPKETQDLILATARKFNYRPNFFARSLRTNRTFMVGVLVPEVSEGYAAMVMSGIEDHLLQEGYFYFVASHRHRADLIDEYPKLMLERSVEGIIAVDTPWHQDLPIPVVTVSGHNRARGVINVLLDHDRAANLALSHLSKLGHRRVAFIKGQEFSSDTEDRWHAILRAAANHKLAIAPELTIQLQGDVSTPDLGYRVTQKFLAKRLVFSALFAFNDISAIGAIRALREHGLRVPEDVSVMGFDDIQSAAFQNPSLTTIRQPLRKMGTMAAQTVLRSIQAGTLSSTAEQIMIEPELIVRDSTRTYCGSRV
jgi:DNA-binding LacI/PurR family transcriptional regulator